MTREEAIEWLMQIKDKYIYAGDEGFDAKRKEALGMAIDALEQTDTHECDVVSRDKVLNLVLDACTDVMDECETVTGICGEEVYTDVREVDAILKCNKRIRNGIRRLPSEPVGNYEQLRPTGKWIDMNGATIFPFWQRYKCSVCGGRADMSNYCPHCGAKMSEEEVG